ncbi:MAG: glycosyltransferase family 4 protein [Chitinispirillaceae bacterium]|nr:glycosyltransferase family 4 protein [Chitinispirillaceae bacterium]
MVIGYDPTPLGAHFGNSSYTTELVRAMATRYPGDGFIIPTFIERRWSIRRICKNTPNVTTASILPNANIFPRPLRKSVTRLARHIELKALHPRYDVYHCTAPTRFVEGARNSIVTIHDLIPLSGRETWSSSWDRNFYRDRLSRVIAECCAIIADSQATRSLVVEHFPGYAGKLSVIPLAASPQFVKRGADCRVLRKYGIDAAHERILMSVGVFTERKNIPGFLDAFASLPGTIRKDVVVVLTGNRWKNRPYAPILDAIARNRLENNVLVIPNMPQEDLVSLYNLAEALVFPSLCEGFGLPVLEAMQCGCPVITSRISSLPEVGGDAAIYCDPEDRESMASTVRIILEDAGLRETLADKGVVRAAAFSWDKTAVAIHGVYEEATGGY